MDNRKIMCDLFRAYYDARINKGHSYSILFFERNYETRIFELYKEIIKNRYIISPSICFISFKPLKREIFAANFRDRIVHHFIYNYINPIFERLFLSDNYSCRIGRGTSYGIKRLNHFIRSCSNNYKKDCYVLKLDIKGYFMAIDHNILYQKVEKTLNRFRETENFNIDLILRLIRQVIFHDSTRGCIVKGKREDWQGLPKTKSLFFAGKDKGLPIGNLTSQLFGNVYLNDFDHFVRYELNCNYYGRYVDDIVIVHQDKEYLKSIIPILRSYLKDNLSLELHPKKIYLQHYSKGVRFLGAVIKPYRLYIANQTKKNFYKKTEYWNDFFMENHNIDKKDLDAFLSSENSYLGIIKRYNTYQLRKKIITQKLSLELLSHISISSDYSKVFIIEAH
ncbi:MAG: reverse transcriptase/maturase family protein [Tissierellia bacterium]|nr:reverse transcriptase/maturase family protein [Tissierellia bacterium]